jgi:hypothetical protein
MGNGLYTIFDTGASDIYLSVLWFDSFVEELFGSMGLGEADYEINDGIVSATCDVDYPDIYFMV